MAGEQAPGEHPGAAGRDGLCDLAQEVFVVPLAAANLAPLDSPHAIKWVNLRQTCPAHLIRKAQKLAESADAEMARSGRRVRAELKLACRMARPGPGPPTVRQWNVHHMRVVGLLTAVQERMT